MTGAVSAIAVFIAALVAFPLIRTAAQDQAQGALANQADMVRNMAVAPHDFDVDQDFGHPDSPQRMLDGVIRYMHSQGIEVQAVVPGESEPQALTPSQIREVAMGMPVSGRTCAEGRCVFIEARPVGAGRGILLS